MNRQKSLGFVRGSSRCNISSGVYAFKELDHSAVLPNLMAFCAAPSLDFLCNVGYGADPQDADPYLSAMNIAYTSDDCCIFAEALEHAWEMFLKAGKLTPRNLDTAKGALTFAILAAAENGERNARRLALAAVGRFERFERTVRNDRSWCQQSKLAV